MTQTNLEKASDLFDEVLLAQVRQMKKDKTVNAAVLRVVRDRLRDHHISVAPGDKSTPQTLAEELGISSDPKTLPFTPAKLPPIDTEQDDAATA